jgi:hypothetical protein
VILELKGELPVEALREILINIVSNLIWVVIVFTVIFWRDKKKKEQIALCMEAYLTFLFKSTNGLSHSVYPYIYLIESKVIEGTILATLLQHIYKQTASIAEQTQSMLAMVESRKLQEKILQIYYRVSMFQTHLAESQLATNLVVGNPTELVEPPRQQEEISIFRTFDKDMDRMTQEIYDLFPVVIRQKVPSEIVKLLNQKSPLEMEYEKKHA